MFVCLMALCLSSSVCNIVCLNVRLSECLLVRLPFLFVFLSVYLYNNSPSIDGDWRVEELKGRWLHISLLIFLHRFSQVMLCRVILFERSLKLACIQNSLSRQINFILIVSENASGLHFGKH